MHNDDFKKIFKLLQDSIYATSLPPALPEQFHSTPELKQFYSDVVQIRDFIIAITRGDLSQSLSTKGYLAGTLKSLQAGLKHLIWQAQMIAQGDFTHRVDFMGEFAEAFNAMVVKLDASVKALEESNRELLREIEERKKFEAALQESQEQYRQLSIIDPLTELFNRRHFYQLAKAELERSARHIRPMAIFIYDLDLFKQINDTYGHMAGDQALRHVAAVSAKEVRKIDILARYGGEEFICMLPETDLWQAHIVAERTRQAIESTPLLYQGRQIKITSSFGLAALEQFDSFSLSCEVMLESIIKQADEALYRAKKTGRNRVVVVSCV